MSVELRPTAARAATRVLGSRPLAATWRRLRPGLRVVAYHDVPDAAVLARHLDLVVEHYTPVSGAQVLAARRGGAPLPDDAVWITFDDGDLSVVRHARPLLVDRGMVATLFVCPGLIEDRRVPWWSVVSAAGRAGRGAVVDGTEHRGDALVRVLKTVPDHRRREVVASLEEVVAPEVDEVLLLADLRAWQADGQEVGNHTWDHPCLDQCPPDEQARQITAAHEWLVDNVAPPELLFAYPNGNRTDPALAQATRLGYGSPLLFDHRLNTPAQAATEGTELSRLRLDAGAPLPRARAVLAGVHPDLFGLVG